MRKYNPESIRYKILLTIANRPVPPTREEIVSMCMDQFKLTKDQIAPAVSQLIIKGVLNDKKGKVEPVDLINLRMKLDLKPAEIEMEMETEPEPEPAKPVEEKINKSISTKVIMVSPLLDRMDALSDAAAILHDEIEKVKQELQDEMTRQADFRDAISIMKEAMKNI